MGSMEEIYMRRETETSVAVEKTRKSRDKVPESRRLGPRQEKERLERS